MDDPYVNNLQTDQRRLRPGIKKLVFSLLVAAVSLGLFCYALDMKFSDLSADQRQPTVKRLPLAISMIGFGTSILVFWSGYLTLARR